MCGVSTNNSKKKYPELERRLQVIASGEWVTVSDFLGWLDQCGLRIARYGDGGLSDNLVPDHRGPEQFIADFFDIDLDKIEEERKSILDGIRNLEVNSG